MRNRRLITPAGKNLSAGPEGRPVIEREVQISTHDGPMAAFVAQPEGDVSFPAIIVLQHIGGLSGTMRDVCRRAAAAGFYAIVPALYHRLGQIVIDPLSTELNIAAIRSIAVNSLTAARVMSDIDATLAFLDTAKAVAPGGRAVLGYGGSAGSALRALALRPEVLKAAGLILGLRYVTDAADSPHLFAEGVRGVVYFGIAGEDTVVPRSVPDEIIAILERHRVEMEVTIHPGVQHGYAFSDRDVYDRNAAELDWIRMKALFNRALGRPAAD
jgi:carboxymethylenebutenolidase